MVGKIKEDLVPLRGAQREEVSQAEAAQRWSAPANGVGGGMQGGGAGSRPWGSRSGGVCGKI